MASPYILPNGSTGSFDHYRPHGHDRTRTAEGDSIMYTNSQSLRKPSSNGSLHTHMHSNSSSSPSFSYHQSENRPSYRANTQIQRLPTVLDALSPSQEKDAMDIPSETATSTAYPQGESYGIPSVGKIALPSGSHNHAGSNHSAVTAYLLLNFGRYPFVHSILSEKDSRRIFYFALSVLLYFLLLGIC
jgi:zinc transporter 5/7